MPFRSQAQRKFLFSQRPDVAKKFVMDSQPASMRPPRIPAYHALTKKLNGLTAGNAPHANMPSTIEDEEKKIKY